MNTIKKPLATLLAAITVGVGLMLAAASPASAASRCWVIVEYVTAFDLEEPGGVMGDGDEIYLKVDGRRFPDDDYVRFSNAPQGHGGSEFEAQWVWIQSGDKIEVKEEDSGWDDRHGDKEAMSCSRRGSQVIHFRERGIHYAVDLTVW